MAGDPTVANAQLDALYGKPRDGAISDRELINDSMPDLSDLITNVKTNILAALNELKEDNFVVSTVAELATTNIPAVVDKITLLGYYTAFDGAGHVRKRGSNITGSLPSADGSYWDYIISNGEVHVKHFGARFNGSSDDTNSINNAISSLAAISGSFSPASSFKLILPPGRGITNGGHIIPSTVKVRVIGAGAYTTVLYLKSSADNFVFDLRSSYSSLEHCNIDGNRSNNTNGLEGVLLSASFTFLHRVYVANCNGDGIAVGKNTGAINHRLLNVDVRFCKGYGINIYPSTGSTDGQYTDVNVGTSGLSGINIQTGSQKMTNVHVWGNGLESTTDNHGFRMSSGNSILSGCQSETNLGHGIYIGSGIKGINIVGGTIWGNCNNAIYIYNASHIVVSGVTMKNNGSKNSAGSTSKSFASMHLEGATYVNVSNCVMFDDGSALEAGSYASTPTYPFLGRTAGVFTISRHYAESTGSNSNVIADNTMVAAQSRSGVAVENVGVLNRYQNNLTGLTTISSLSSADTITLPAERDMIRITGTTAITSIAAAATGSIKTLIFTSAGVVVTNGNNISIPGNYTSTAEGTLTIRCDGTNWYKI